MTILKKLKFNYIIYLIVGISSLFIYLNFASDKSLALVTPFPRAGGVNILNPAGNTLPSAWGGGGSCTSNTQCAGITQCMADGGPNAGNGVYDSQPRRCSCLEWVTGGSFAWGSANRGYYPVVNVRYCDGTSSAVLFNPTSIASAGIAVGDRISPMLLSFQNGDNPNNVIWNVPTRITSGSQTINYFSDSGTFFRVENQEAININFNGNFNRWRPSDPNLSCRPGGQANILNYNIAVNGILAEHPYNNCGSCNLSSGSCARTCTNRCGASTTVACAASACCAATAPDQPVLNYPANNSTISDLTPQLRWNALSNWGSSCSGSPVNTFTVRWKVDNGALNTCATTSLGWTTISNLGSNTLSYELTQVQQLTPGNTYCWFVTASNSSVSTNSDVWRFQIVRDPFFMTYGGDVYVGGGLDNDLLRGLTNSTQLTDMSLNQSTNFNARLKRIRTELSFVTQPRFSSNIFIGSNAPRLSNKNATIIGFTDNSPLEYATGGNFYNYYRNLFASQSTNITKNSPVTSSGSNFSLRNAFGSSSTAQKQIINITKSTPSNLILKINNNVNPQVGFPNTQGTYDWSVNPIQDFFTCDNKTIYLIPGNLEISADIRNTTPDSSCVFIIGGRLTIKLPDKVGANLANYSKDYRQLDGLFFASSLTITGRDDQGSVIVNGAIITNNGSATTNSHDVVSDVLNRPQELYTYDARHLVIWGKEFEGNLSRPIAREERFLQLIK